MVRFMVLYDQPEDAVDFDHHYREIHIPQAAVVTRVVKPQN